MTRIFLEFDPFSYVEGHTDSVASPLMFDGKVPPFCRASEWKDVGFFVATTVGFTRNDALAH